MKTNETCKKCGGICKPSKGILNIHNIQTNDLNKEFETKLVDCLKCESCGHSWIPEYPKETFDLSSKTSTKEQALIWWNGITYGKKQHLIIENLGHEKALSRLTGREIEEIWNQEMQRQEFILEDKLFGGEKSNYKPNQKQFKIFDESLFKSYISKFSDEDKIRMYKVFSDLLEVNSKYRFLDIIDKAIQLK